MVIRIVKMVFRPEEITAFKALFESRKSMIRNFEGCTHLELWQDKQHPAIFFTYSWWQSEEYLNNYRESLFLMKHGPLQRQSLQQSRKPGQ
jgi:heme-degrading monooxygenase HmoA